MKVSFRTGRRAGAIASALRFVAKAILSGDSTQKFLRSVDVSMLQHHLTSEKGLGHVVIEKFLEGIPNMNGGIVMQELANLKASGNYARIIFWEAHETPPLVKGEGRALPSPVCRVKRISPLF